MAEKQKPLPLGAAFSHARASGKDQSQSAQRRRANDFLRREGHSTMSRKVAKGILDRWRAMTTDERADEFNLRASGVPPEVARALAMTGNGKAPKRKPKFGGLISKMGPTLGELDAAGHTHGLTGNSALRGATWRKRRRQQKRVSKGGPGSGPHPGGGAKAHLSAAQSHLAAAKVARGKGDHATADTHQQKASEFIRAALTAHGVNKAGEFDESKHPRADNGEFGSGGGGQPKDKKGMTASDHRDQQDKHRDAAYAAFQRKDEDAMQKHQNKASQHHLAAQELDGGAPETHIPTVEVSKNQKSAMDNYVKGSENDKVSYHSINASLGGSPLPDGADAKKSKTAATALNQAIAAHTIDSDATVFRGGPLPTKLQVGQIISTPRVTSASGNRGTASGFADPEQDGGHRHAVMTIHVKSGDHVLPMSRHVQHALPEEEYVFGSNQKFRVDEIKRDATGLRRVTLSTVR